MLDCDGISLSFPGKPVLSGCALHLGAQEHAALMGPSGCGKTSLLRIVLSLQQPDAGSVRLRAKRPAAVFQEPRLLPWCTALENLLLVLPDRPESRERARHWLELLGLADALHLYPDELSGGMQQRLSIARALAVEPDFLVLDEPFKGMDAALAEHVLSVLSSACAETALLVATHSEAEAEALHCRILRYRDGRFL